LWSRALAGHSFSETVHVPNDLDGRPAQCWEVQFYPLLDREGRVTAAMHIAREVTERVQKEARANFALEWERVQRLHAQEREEQLGTENQELNRVTEDLQYFLSLVAHDIREPLRTVSSYAQLLTRRHRRELSQDGQEYLDFVLAGAERMRQLVEGFLASLRGGEDRTELISLNRCLQDAIGGLQAKIAESNAQIEAGELPVVFGRRLELAEVFQNLLSNAIAYRKPGVAPDIKVSARQCGDLWQVTVADNGLGFPMSKAIEIWQFRTTLGGHDEGRGIGLSLVKRIVEEHGGTVSVQSEPGYGSSFQFTLPQLRYQSGRVRQEELSEDSKT
jgi:light-regulated signal transduction histidine kinase (bacteriophytochrome)